MIVVGYLRMANSGIYHLFVYGSLRKGFQSEAYEYISRFFTLVGHAKVKGKLFDMGSYPAAIPVNDESYIIGELYKIADESEFSWAIGQLDDYEGVNVESDEVQLYRRELADVLMEKKVIPAWIYWYNGDVSGKPAIASGDMMEYLKSK
ncbi:MAG: gamma-glutamylcyclotransferase family protein [Bacteroidota bacterium]|nr:gamma-glutamylcyclotransferase family protein [Bacteroidota bacterium]